MIAAGLSPDGFRLRLDAFLGVEHQDRPVEHAQASLYFRREIDMTRRIDEIERVISPRTRDRGAEDRDAALLFLLVEIRGGGSVVHLAHLVSAAGVKQDAFRRRRLAGVDVRNDSDVPNAPQARWVADAVVTVCLALCCHRHHRALALGSLVVVRPFRMSRIVGRQRLSPVLIRKIDPNRKESSRPTAHYSP